MNVAISPTDYERVRKAAAREDMTLSTWVREVLMSKVVQSEESRRKKVEAGG